MVVVDTVSTRFEADLLAAKLGANGILWEVRGGFQRMLMYPVGPLDVLVPVEEEEEARLVLSPDAEVSPDVVFEGQDPQDFAPGRSSPRAPSPAVRWMISLGVGLWVFALLWALFTAFW